MEDRTYRVTVLDEKPHTDSSGTTFSNNLKKYRTYRDLSQKYMADQLNVTASAYGKWERGIREPHTELIIRIAEVLKIPVGWLFERIPCNTDSTKKGDM